MAEPDPLDAEIVDRLKDFRAATDRDGARDAAGALLDAVGAKVLGDNPAHLRAQLGEARAEIERLRGLVAAADEFGDRHVIDLREDGWTIAHPLSCRAVGLFDCPVNGAATDLPGPPRVGRFTVHVDQDGRLAIGEAVDPSSVERVRSDAGADAHLRGALDARLRAEHVFPTASDGPCVPIATPYVVWEADAVAGRVRLVWPDGGPDVCLVTREAAEAMADQQNQAAGRSAQLLEANEDLHRGLTEMRATLDRQRRALAEADQRAELLRRQVEDAMAERDGLQDLLADQHDALEADEANMRRGRAHVEAIGRALGMDGSDFTAAPSVAAALVAERDDLAAALDRLLTRHEATVTAIEDAVTALDIEHLAAYDVERIARTVAGVFRDGVGLVADLTGDQRAALVERIAAALNDPYRRARLPRRPRPESRRTPDRRDPTRGGPVNTTSAADEDCRVAEDGDHCAHWYGD